MTETPTHADIYAMAMESNTAYKFRDWLLEKAGETETKKVEETA